MWTNLSGAMSPTVSWVGWLWIALAAIAIARSIRSVRVLPNVPKDDTNSVTLFAGTALIAAEISFFVFLRIAKMPTQVWYFLPLSTFASVFIAAALGILPLPVPSWPLVFSVF